MHQHFIKLRGAIFATRGYCLNAPRLSKNRDAHFLVKDAAGATLGLDPVPGCSGDPGESDVVQLWPYPDEKAAREALMLVIYALPAALDGDDEARELLGVGWLKMLTEGLRLTQQSEPMQLELLKNLFGAGRILDELNRRGTLAFVGEPDMVAMLDEALPIRAAA